MTIALTFDIEEYFQVTGFADSVRPAHWDLYEPRAERNTNHILDLLARRNTRATFFVLGWLASRNPRLVRRIAEAGHEVASHGYWHQRVTHQTPRQFREDVRASKRLIEDTLSQPVIGYRAPSFSIAPDRAWAFEILVEEGFEFDSSVAAGRRTSCSHLAADGRLFLLPTPAGPIHEFPMPTIGILGRNVPVGGGGYFRMYPYSATRMAFRRLIAASKPVCVYLHPWEFDADQPRLQVPFAKSFKHRVKIKSTWAKLERLLDDFRCDTMSSVFGTCRGRNLAQVA